MKYRAKRQNWHLYKALRLNNSKISAAYGSCPNLRHNGIFWDAHKAFSLRFCLTFLKNSSICQQSLYKPLISWGRGSRLLVRNSNHLFSFLTPYQWKIDLRPFHPNAAQFLIHWTYPDETYICRRSTFLLLLKVLENLFFAEPYKAPSSFFQRN